METVLSGSHQDAPTYLSLGALAAQRCKQDIHCTNNSHPASVFPLGICSQQVLTVILKELLPSCLQKLFKEPQNKWDSLLLLCSYCSSHFHRSLVRRRQWQVSYSASRVGNLQGRQKIPALWRVPFFRELWAGWQLLQYLVIVKQKTFLSWFLNSFPELKEITLT